MARMFRKDTILIFTAHSRATARAALGALLVLLILAGCGPASGDPIVSPTPARAGRLTPYHTPSPSVTGVPTRALTATTTPAPPTPTPKTHEVKQGEDLSGLALRYGIDLAELIAANPTVNPRAMSIGTVLIIPESKTPQPTGQTAQPGILPSPTPISVGFGPLRCTRSRDGGVWCFQGVTNTQEYPVESLTGTITLRGGNGETAAQKANLPLDTLQPGASLPLAAYFTPDEVSGLTDPILGSSEAHTALPYRDDGRYVVTQAQNQQVFLSPDALSAEITLEVTVAEGEMDARRVWVAAVAFDEEDNIIGVRRWERPDDTPLEAGETLPVTMHIYSAGGEIARIEITTEARP